MSWLSEWLKEKTFSIRWYYYFGSTLYEKPYSKLDRKQGRKEERPDAKAGDVEDAEGGK